MHLAIFAGVLPACMKEMKYVDLIFWPNHLLIKLNVCAKFEQNRSSELYHLLASACFCLFVCLFFSRTHS